MFSINNPNIAKLLEEKLLYFSPLFAALCFLSTENKLSKIKSLQVILLHLILDSLIFITGIYSSFFLAYIYIPLLIVRLILDYFDAPLFLIFPLGIGICLILLLLNFFISKVVKDLRELFSSISLNLASSVLFIVFLFSLLFLISLFFILPCIALIPTDVFEDRFGKYLGILALISFVTYFLFLLIVGGMALAVKKIVLSFAENPNFIDFFNIFKNSAEKLLTIIENLDNNTRMKNLLASSFYFLAFSSPSLIFLLTTKNEFTKLHSLQAIFLRQYLLKKSTTSIRISFLLAIIICWCMCLPGVLGTIYLTDLFKTYLASFIILTPFILSLAIILYYYYPVFSLYRETQEGKCTESPIVKIYIHKFLTKPIEIKPIEIIEEKIFKLISFDEVLISFLALLTKDANSSLKNRILRGISLWLIKEWLEKNYQGIILTTILLLWGILFCSFSYFISLSSHELPDAVIILYCAFAFLPIFISIALPKILPAPKLITSFIDQLSKEDDSLKEENKNGK